MSSDTPTLVTGIVTLLTAVMGSTTAVWRWVSKQLEECKGEHRESRARIEEMHEEIKMVSVTVKELEGKLQLRDYQMDCLTDHRHAYDNQHKFPADSDKTGIDVGHD